MLNKAILMGRLVADPELRRTQQGTAVTSFTLAVNRSFTRNGEQPQTDFIDIVAWQNTAEFVSKWFKKGMQVAVSGRIQTRTWEDRQGQKRKSVEVVAEEVHFAESKRDFESRGNNSSAAADPFAMPGRNSSDFIAVSDNDDDLPF
jgi:single-strand DNA-binding protein